MGQAKARGTKEERVQQAIQRKNQHYAMTSMHVVSYGNQIQQSDYVEYTNALAALENDNIVEDDTFESDEATVEESKIGSGKTIAKAAILTREGLIYSVEQPGRHHNIIAIMEEVGEPTPIVGRQGFLLDDGTFVGRHKARQIAEASGQLLERAIVSKSLFSEDVW